MKFSDIEEQGWAELAPFLDTCLLPITGMTGAEQPWEATRALEELRDALDGLEQPFKGRVVTYPALHYLPEGEAGELLLGRLCDKLRSSGFRYVVAVTAKSEEELPLSRGNRDLLLRVTPEELGTAPQDTKRRLMEEVTGLWAGKQS
ncbi:DUF2487 family protein [Paenibacillus silviterrae]|uniref:DUF2487 family protein n=1 Tax=Paenibacillus silviterrae TaxID=3242194 RepID=UPI0025434E02|nr:DUF2487 family protein [Paenibacillus chinjuensis]